jgi:hypothetical protein
MGKQAWDDPSHDVVKDLREAKRKGRPNYKQVFRPLVNRRDAEVLIINGWVEGRDFDVYGE